MKAWSEMTDEEQAEVTRLVTRLSSDSTRVVNDSAYLAKRVADLERRVEQLEVRASDLERDPRIGRRCRMLTPSMVSTALVVSVHRGGSGEDMLAIRAENWSPHWTPMLVRASEVEWLDAPPAAPPADPLEHLRLDAQAVHDRVSHALRRHGTR